MQIVKVKIKNFRNLNDVEISLHPHINFLVGENDLGKSNFLSMLDVIFNGRKFREDDFFDRERAINLEITLRLNDVEKGNFEDYFDPSDSDLINIVITQENPDEDIKYFHKESGQEIHYTDIRCANFIKYDPLRNPKEELSFHRGRGVGKFLNYLVKKYFQEKYQKTEENENNEAREYPVIEDFIKQEAIKQITNYINKKFEKLRTFKNFGITTFIEGDVESLIYRVITMKDSKGLDIQKMGYGGQFIILIVLSILEKIMHLQEEKRRQKCIYSFRENDKNKNCISLILGLDEPEIHLHPYMQRSLVKYINKIISNEDEEFASLLKELFDIDKIFGQAIIVTHSPNILLNDYKQIARFFPFQGTSIKVKSGINIRLDPRTEKHLLMNLPYIKEAFFSKCVIIVEGETELGALPTWGEKLLRDIDEYGISIIKSSGKGGIKPLVELLNSFNIKTVSIKDRDDGSDLDGYDFITNGKDFEEDLVNKLLGINVNLLFQLIEQLDDRGLERKIEEKKLTEIATKYSITISWEEGDYKFIGIRRVNDSNLVKTMFLAWFNINKSIVLGRAIGEKIEGTVIPESYFNAINKAKWIIDDEKDH